MRILVVGALGMLGQDVVAELQKKGFEPIAVDREQLDITDPVACGRIVAGEFGDLDGVVNCAAYTKVDQAEDEREAAFFVNALGAGMLARATAMSGIPIVHISTDYVFDGQADKPYTPQDATSPTGVYGESKLEGERSVLDSGAQAYVLRTSWLFGAGGPCFPKTMIRVAGMGKTLNVVHDQRGCPTYTVDLAQWIVKVLEVRPAPGIYHAGGPEAMTWYEFARQVLDIHTSCHQLSRFDDLHPITTDQFPTKAKRPAYSVLDSSNLEAVCGPMQDLAEALKDFSTRIGPTL